MIRHYYLSFDHYTIAMRYYILVFRKTHTEKKLLGITSKAKQNSIVYIFRERKKKNRKCGKIPHYLRNIG